MDFQTNHSVGLPDLPFFQDFIELACKGDAQGWHERNGGNLSYLLRESDVAAARPFFDEKPGAWLPTGTDASTIAGEFLLLTASGSFFSALEKRPVESAGIVEIDVSGFAWRRVWGFARGGRPTSELASHLAIQALRKTASDGSEINRVVYHAHPANLIALTTLLPANEKSITQALWKTMTETILVFPQGIGVLDWMVPCGAPIAEATVEIMEKRNAVIWALHGAVVAGTDFDDAFSLMHTMDKSSGIYLAARAANGGLEPPSQVSDEGLREIARELGLDINESLLD